MIETQICILGAGPGGAATALRLAKSGIPSVLIDKAQFPRDKICGDGITGRTVAILDRIDPEIVQQLAQLEIQQDSWGVTFWADNKREFKVPFRNDKNKSSQYVSCFVSKRVDFDNFLIEKVKKQPLIQFFENIDIETHERIPADGTNKQSGWVLGTKKGDFKIKTTLVIAANGANSPFTRHVAKIPFDPKHTAAAVRAYYKNITGCHQDNYIELHFLKEYIPGYFWIFPLPNGEANVGFGMLSSTISKNKINLKKQLLDIIENSPGIKERFQQAELIDNVVGFPLPCGSKRRLLSDDNYMLVGDAACLVDPLTGEGIGNAVHSGYIAAEQAEKCLKDNNFSAAFLKDYDTRIWRVMGTELKLSHRLQQLGKYPFFFNFILWLASKNVQISDLIYSMFNDIDVRKRITNPVFWLKTLVNAK